MSRSVTFNGITRYKPGGITHINAENLNQVLQSPNSIVAIIGEAEGGEPHSIISMDDPSRAGSILREGPLVDAARLAFQASADPRVPGGASRVYLYKTNDSTKAVLNLASAPAEQVVSSTATGGSSTTVVDSALTAPDGQWVGYHLVLRPFSATAEVRQITGYVQSTTTITVDSAFASDPTASDAYLIYRPEVEALDSVDSVTSTSTVLAANDLTFVDDEHNGRWVYIVASPSLSYFRQIVDTTAAGSLLTVSPALPTAPAAGTFFQVLPNSIRLASKDWGAHTNNLLVDIDPGSAPGSKVITTTFEGQEEISPSVGGRVLVSVLYRGGSSVVDDTVAAGSTASVVNLTTGALTPGDHVGQQVLIGDDWTVIQSNTASALTLDPPLSEAPTTGDAVSIRSLTAGVVEVLGASGKATSLSTTLTGVVGDDLSITFPAGQTLRQLVSAINTNTNYLATVHPGINPDTNLAEELDFNISRSVLVSANIAQEGLSRDAQDVVDWFNQFSQWVEAERADDVSVYAGSGAPNATITAAQFSGGSRGVSSNSSFQAGFDELLRFRVNSVIPLVDQDLANEGFGSTATWASVAAQLTDHVATARGTAQDKAGERGGFIGRRGNLSQIIAAANSINDYDVQLVAQNPVVLSPLGELQEQGPRSMAVMAASMRAGMPEVAEPLTHKYLRTSGVTQDPSWDPGDVSDANDLIRNGVLFTETIDGRGTRWVRDITTWVVDDNLAWSEGSVRDAVRYVSFDLRERLVERFTGRKAKPATINNVKEYAATILEEHRSQSIIVDGTDPSTGEFVRAWHNLKIYTDGDILRLTVGICPVLGINFQLNDLYLFQASQAA